LNRYVILILAPGGTLSGTILSGNTVVIGFNGFVSSAIETPETMIKTDRNKKWNFNMVVFFSN
jgi:hypothetical protein